MPFKDENVGAKITLFSRQQLEDRVRDWSEGVSKHTPLSSSAESTFCTDGRKSCSRSTSRLNSFSLFWKFNILASTFTRALLKALLIDASISATAVSTPWRRGANSKEDCSRLFSKAARTVRRLSAALFRLTTFDIWHRIVYTRNEETEKRIRKAWVLTLTTRLFIQLFAVSCKIKLFADTVGGTSWLKRGW